VALDGESPSHRPSTRSAAIHGHRIVDKQRVAALGPRERRGTNRSVQHSLIDHVGATGVGNRSWEFRQAGSIFRFVPALARATRWGAGVRVRATASSSGERKEHPRPLCEDTETKRNGTVDVCANQIILFCAGFDRRARSAKASASSAPEARANQWRGSTKAPRALSGS